MKEVRLADLDELALKVRDKIARSYILEAIDAYRGGAYRSSIVSTWIAVTFDIISKIRELSNQGDPMAQAFINSLDQAIAVKQVKQLQNIEEDLLKKAKDDFEFLSDQEFVDFVRLKEDRNLCAHPAFVTEEMLFEPEPERVRMHMVHVVKHLLQHQPVQGKNAIERIIKDIKTNTFPLTLDSACIFLNSRYLDRAKKSLIENLIILLLKAVLRGDISALPLTHSRQIILTLQAVSKRHPDIYEERMMAKLSTIVVSLDDDCLSNIFGLLVADPRCWYWLDESTKIRLKLAVENSFRRGSIRRTIFEVIAIDDLRPTILQGFKKLPPKVQINIIKFTPRPEFADQAISLYSEADSYRGAEILGESLILRMASCFSSTDVQKILKVVEGNKQIYDASGTPAILDQLYEKTERYLPGLHESWKSLFEFLFCKKYAKLYDKIEGSDFWSETSWESLVNRLKVAGVGLPPEQQLNS